jgi:hypothetical protein
LRKRERDIGCVSKKKAKSTSRREGRKEKIENKGTLLTYLS